MKHGELVTDTIASWVKQGFVCGPFVEPEICYPIGSSTLNSVELNSVFLLFPIHPLLGKMF